MVLVGLRDIAAYMHVSEGTIKLWMRTREFPVSWYPSGRRVIDTSMIAAWLLARRKTIMESKQTTNQVSDIAA